MPNTRPNPQKAKRSPPKGIARKRVLAVADTALGSTRKAPGSARPSGVSGWTRMKLGLRGDITGLQGHDLVTQGVSVAAAREVLKAFAIIDEKQFYGVLGITGRTLQRRAASARKTLDANASDRVLRLVSVTDQAITVMGSQESAERWLSSPAIGLDRRKPIDLLGSTEGTGLVKTLLTRMEYGVYA